MKSNEEIIQELEIVAFSTISDYVTWDKSGRMKLKKDIPPEKMLALEELSVDENGIVTKIKMSNKIEVLVKLNEQFLSAPKEYTSAKMLNNLQQKNR